MFKRKFLDSSKKKGLNHQRRCFPVKIFTLASWKNNRCLHPSGLPELWRRRGMCCLRRQPCPGKHGRNVLYKQSNYHVWVSSGQQKLKPSTLDIWVSIGVENFGKHSLFVENDDPKGMLDCIELLPAFLHFSTLFTQAVLFVLGMVRGNVFEKKHTDVGCQLHSQSKGLPTKLSPKKIRMNLFLQRLRRSPIFFLFLFLRASKDMLDVFRCHFLRHVPKTLNCSI